MNQFKSSFITKRDGTIQEYDINKIRNVLMKAFVNTNVECSNLDEIMVYINDELNNNPTHNYHIEEIQDLVEKTLMLYKYFDTARHYINYRNEHNKNRDNTTYLSKIPDNIKTPWGMLGYITYKRTYARTLENSNDSDETEEYRDTILRVLRGCQKQLNTNFTNQELEKAYKYLMELKCSVAGRFLWQLGTETISKLGIMSLQNCAFVKIDEPIKPFLWIFDVLMLGTGVGFNIQRENIRKLPPVLDVPIVITRNDVKDADFIVPDSREGWVYLLEKVLEAYFYKGQSFTYSTMLIRSAGTKIKGFGGVASGPEDLVKGIKLIQDILNNRRGTHLTSVDCLDIINIIASIVVAGNVRRCIPAGAKVHTNIGLINIEDIIGGDEVLTTYGYKKVKHVFNQGIQEVLVIKTDKGDFRCTHNHRMLVLNNPTNQCMMEEGFKKSNHIGRDGEQFYWAMASELRKGDYLITSKTPIIGNSIIKLPSFEYTNRRDRILTPDLTFDICWFFGFVSNNCIFNDSYNATIIIDCGSNELLKKIVKIMDKFGTSIRIITDIDISNNTYIIKLISNTLYNYFMTHFVNQIPYFINETIYNNRIGFITGIFESKNTTMTVNSIMINNITEQYKKDLSVLLYSCGIQNKSIDNNTLIIDDKYNIGILTTNKLINKNYPNLKDDNDYMCINSTKVDKAEIIEIYKEYTYDTYDIEVEDVHEFFCDGFLTHNSALICLGDYDDIEYLNAKRWDLGNIPNWRCMSNNSVVCNDISKLPEEFWNGYNGNGEPYGLINIDLSRKIGRIKDGGLYPDPDVEGYNPCAEQSLANYETCCLSEIYLCNIENYEQLKDIASIVYRICKHSLLLKCHQKATEEIVHKNMRMGIGITGYLQSTEEQKSWLNDLYEYLRDYDKEYSKKIGVPTSVKLTTVKPSGTLSLLAGVTSGAHPAIYQYFIRRIRISSSNKQLIDLARRHKCHIEYQKNFDGTDDKNTMVIEFPCCYPEGTILAKDMSAVDQLNTIKELQTNWSDNSVSVTIYYKKEELDEIKEWLRNNYNDNIKTCSFLLHNEHGFKQAPFEEITKEEYMRLMSIVVPITSGKIMTMDEKELSSDCPNGVCPIR
jgi:ribonucleotide reductase alpha subunit